jgi:imidazolonepropionase-like amidohydrolase
LAEEKVILVKNGTLIDGSGADPIEKSLVLIEDEEIKEVGTRGEVDTPEKCKVIDASGKHVLPGLIDAHLHLWGFKSDNMTSERFVSPQSLKLLRSSVSARRLLEAGFTTVKDCGSSNALYLKKAIEEGTLRGPRIVAAGYPLSQTFGHCDQHFLPLETSDARTGIGSGLICDGVDECIKAARYTLREGADFVKLCGTTGGVMSERDKPDHVQFNLDEIRAVVQVAKNVGTYVTAHAQGTEGIRNAIVGGVKTVDHVFYPDEECLKMGKNKDVVFVATLSVGRRIMDGGTDVGYPEWGVKKMIESWDEMAESIAWLQKEGATVASGTDFLDTPLMKMGTNALELELLMKHSGFTPMEAIVSATSNAAKACGLESKIGTIEKGKMADLLIVDGNPLKDITVLQKTNKIEMVMKEGKIEKNLL